MTHGHNNLPGSDLLAPQHGMVPAHDKEIFSNKSGGGAGRRRHADADAHPAEADHGPEPIKEEKVAKKEPTVTLTHPKWGAEVGHFDEVIVVTVEGQPPPDNKDLTKVEFTAYLVDAHGKKNDKPLARGEGHLKDGKAEGEILLPPPEAKPGEEPPEKYHAVFTAKHSRSKPVESGKIEVKEGPAFDGAIFYSPTRKEYFVLENADEAKAWLKSVAELDEVRLQAEKLRDTFKTMAAAEREKKQAELEKKIDALFEKHAIGRAPVLDELIKVSWSKAWGKCNTWVYAAKNATPKGKKSWLKTDDPKLKKKLQKELKKSSEGGKEEPESIFQSKIKYQFLAEKNLQQAQWPVKWSHEGHDQGKSDHFSWKAEAAVCRFVAGFDGAEATFDLKKKKFEVKGSGSASYGIFEGEAKGEFHFPDKDGIDLLYYVRKNDSLTKAVVAGKQCRLKIKFTLSGSTFVGASASAALTFPSLDFGGKEASVETTVGAFVGGQAKGKAALSLEWWNGIGSATFAALGEFGGELAGSAGIGAELQWKLEFKKGKFIMHASAEAVVGLGGKGGFSLDLDLKQGKDLALHLLECVDYHYLEEITEEAYEALTNYSFAKMVQVGHWIDAHADQAMSLVADFDYWLSSHRPKINVPKEQLTEAAAQRSSLRFATPHAIGQSIITLMQTREDSDFKSIMWMLYSSDSTHKLEWILRVVSQQKIKGGNVVEIQASQSEALKAGAARIRDFGIGPDPMTPNSGFLAEFDAWLQKKGIKA